MTDIVESNQTESGRLSGSATKSLSGACNDGLLATPSTGARMPVSGMNVGPRHVTNTSINFIQFNGKGKGRSYTDSYNQAGGYDMCVNGVSKSEMKGRDSDEGRRARAEALVGKRLEGSVKWFRSDKAYGFIEATEAIDDVFVHSSNVYFENGETGLLVAAGTEVSFDLQMDENDRLQASSVTMRDGSPVEGLPLQQGPMVRDGGKGRGKGKGKGRSSYSKTSHTDNKSESPVPPQGPSTAKQSRSPSIVVGNGLQGHISGAQQDIPAQLLQAPPTAGGGGGGGGAPGPMGQHAGLMMPQAPLLMVPPPSVNGVVNHQQFLQQQMMMQQQQLAAFQQMQLASKNQQNSSNKGPPSIPQAPMVLMVGQGANGQPHQMLVPAHHMQFMAMQQQLAMQQQQILPQQQQKAGVQQPLMQQPLWKGGVDGHSRDTKETYGD